MPIEGFQIDLRHHKQGFPKTFDLNFELGSDSLFNTIFPLTQVVFKILSFMLLRYQAQKF